MNVKEKISRILAKNPELKDTIKSLEDTTNKERLHKIVDSLPSKVLLVGKTSEETARMYHLAHYIARGYIHTTQVTTLDLLDAYTNNGEDEDARFTSLSQVTDDLVIIYDSRAFIPNKQKTNMIMQVFEQNSNVIYYYKGAHKLFLQEHQSLLDYCKENNIPKIHTDTNTQVYDKRSKEDII